MTEAVVCGGDAWGGCLCAGMHHRLGRVDFYSKGAGAEEQVHVAADTGDPRHWHCQYRRRPLQQLHHHRILLPISRQ